MALALMALALVAARDPWAMAAALAARALAFLGDRQFGVVTTPQLHALGFDHRAIHRMTKAGRLIRLYRGVYAVGHVQLMPEGRRLAATLAFGAHAVLADASAGKALGIRDSRSEYFDVIVPTRNGVPSRDGVRVHRVGLDPRDVTRLGLLPVTTPMRTVFDLSRTLHPRSLRSTVRQTLQQEVYDAAALGRLIDANPRRPGVPALTRVLEEVAGVALLTRSKQEETIYDLVVGAGFPAPRMNDNKTFPNGNTYSLDVHWPDHRAALELDSPWHDNPLSAADDEQRDHDLTLYGYRHARVRDTTLATRPDSVLRLVGTLLAPAPVP